MKSWMPTTPSSSVVRPVGPEAFCADPLVGKSVWLKAQEEHDDERIDDPLDLWRVAGGDRAEHAAELRKSTPAEVGKDGNEDCAEDRAAHAAEAADDDHRDRLDADDQAEAVGVEIADVERHQRAGDPRDEG